MFTGIIEEVGKVRRIEPVAEGLRLSVEARQVLSDVSIGSSMAVSGCCLTVTGFTADEFSVDVVPETVNRTNLSQICEGDLVNLERPLAANGRFDGHVVQGHVDTVSEIVAVKSQSDDSLWFSFVQPQSLEGQIVEKGSISLDGVSLTVAGLDMAKETNEQGIFHVALIPHTLENTTFGFREIGSQVNVEADIFARYIGGFLSSRSTNCNKSPGGD